MQPLVVERVGPRHWPALTRRHVDDEYRSRVIDFMGEQAEWGFAIPLIFRALASPTSGEPLPRAPRQGDPHWFSCGYWSGLLSMLMYSLGWARPDLGLWWWYANGKPIDDDPRFEILSVVFDHDGQLDWLAAWLWQDRFKNHSGRLIEEVTEWTDQGKLVPADGDWIDRQRHEAIRSAIFAPIGADLDGLHLRMHFGGPLETETASPLALRSNPNEGTAVLVLESMVGWYRHLCLFGESLPPSNHRSWKVDVVVKPTGWLGTYRKSLETGLWFSGRHLFHVVGT